MNPNRVIPPPRHQPAGESSGKKPYRTPRLTVHGDLRLITMVKGGGKGDGAGNPKTKV